MSTASGLRSGSSFGHYRIVEPLGKGGMATVYRAYEENLDRYVALKVLPAEFLSGDGFAARFKREAQVAARLEHPHIVPIYSFGIEQGVPWMAMRLIAGGTLSALVKARRLAPEHAIELLRGVAEALDHAHAAGVIHRDVKPQNILLDESGSVYLADFGIARMLEGSTSLTATGVIQGTPEYMAPEQALGGKLDARCDIYALGVVAYLALVGRAPFTGTTPMAVLMQHVREPVPLPPPSELSGPLVAALHKCLAKDPNDRWPSATSFVDALERGVGGGIAAPTATLPNRAPEMARPRGWAWLAGVGGLCLFLVAGAGVGYLALMRLATTPAAVPTTTAAVPTTPRPAPPATATLEPGVTTAPRTQPRDKPGAREAPPPTVTPSPVAANAAPSVAASSPRPGASQRIRVFCEARLEPQRFKKADEEDVLDSLRDVQKAIGKSRTLELAESRGNADVILEVLERGKPFASTRKVRVRIRAGGEAVELVGQNPITRLDTWGGAAERAVGQAERWLAARNEALTRPGRD